MAITLLCSVPEDHTTHVMKHFEVIFLELSVSPFRPFPQFMTSSPLSPLNLLIWVQTVRRSIYTWPLPTLNPLHNFQTSHHLSPFLVTPHLLVAWWSDLAEKFHLPPSAFRWNLAWTSQLLRNLEYFAFILLIETSCLWYPSDSFCWQHLACSEWAFRFYLSLMLLPEGLFVINTV